PAALSRRIVRIAARPAVPPGGGRRRRTRGSDAKPGGAPPPPARVASVAISFECLPLIRHSSLAGFGPKGTGLKTRRLPWWWVQRIVARSDESVLPRGQAGHRSRPPKATQRRQATAGRRPALTPMRTPQPRSVPPTQN